MGIGFKWCGASGKTRKWHRLHFVTHTHKTHTPHAEAELPLHAENYPGRGQTDSSACVPMQEGCSEMSASPGCGRTPGTCPWPSTSACLPLLSLRATRLGSLEPPRRAGSGARTSTGAAPSRPAGDEGLRGIHFPSSLGAMEPPASLPCSRSGSAPGGASKSCARKAKEELPNLPGEGESGGEGAVCQLCAGSLSSLRVREEGLLQPGKALRLLSSSCYFLLLQWDCLATSIIPPRCVTGKILSSILMAFLRFTRPLVDLTTTITTTKASVKTSSPA